MQRILFWLGLIWLFSWWWRKQSRRNRGFPPMSGDSPSAGASKHHAEPMARCAECGVYIPISESLQVGGQRYCCAKHAGKASAQ